MNHINLSESSSNDEVETKNNTESEIQKLSKILPIDDVLDRYLTAIRSINQTARIALPHITKWTISEIDKEKNKMERFIPGFPENAGNQQSVTLESARDFAEFTDTIRRLEELSRQRSTEVLARSLFTQLFAEFDSYIGQLLKIIYLKNDQLLKGISREISLTDLLDYEDLNAVKLSMLEKEIETFRRDSYIEQFSNLEKKFNLPLKKFKEWPDFVELSQRRNILTHNGGVISDQYLIVCEKEGYRFNKKPQLGETLDVTYDYFLNASRLLSKVGLMLAYTLWLKIFPKEADDIHESMNNTIFKCLKHNRWIFVADLEDFVLSAPMRKDISEIKLRIRIINAAIGLKFSGNDEDAVRLLNSVDWSASYRDFKLAIAVLHERYIEATDIMRSIGRNGELIDQSSYHTWPLFTKFREIPEFYDAYFQIYDEPFAEIVKTGAGAVEAHAKSSESSTQRQTDPKITDVQPIEPKPKRKAKISNSASVKAAKKISNRPKKGNMISR